MAVVGAPLALLFGFLAWLLRPRHVSEAWARRLYERQNGLFKRLGIKALIGPDWPDDDHTTP